MVGLLAGCSADGEIVRGRSEQRESFTSSFMPALTTEPGDGAAPLSLYCWPEREQQAVWRKVPLAAGWLGRTIPASRYIVGDTSAAGDVFVVLPGGDRAIPDVVLGRDVEPTGPDGDRAFEFVDETGKKISVRLPTAPAQEQVHRVAWCR